MSDEPQEKSQQIVRRDAKTGHLLKGSQLNPGGRPAGREAALRALFGEHGEKAAEIVHKIATGELTTWVVDKFGIAREVGPTLELRYTASTWSYERINGKTVQPVEVSGPQGTPIAIEAFKAVSPGEMNELLVTGTRILKDAGKLPSGADFERVASEVENESEDLRKAGLEPR